MGRLSVAHAAFYGVGAYTAAIMAVRLGSPFLVNLVCAVVISCVFGAIVGVPGLRVRDDYFVIATFAFQVIAFSVLNNWVSFTGGPMGLPGIPQPAIGGWIVSSHLEFLILVGCCCGLTLLICYRIVQSPMGRVLKGIREDEVFVEASGKNVAVFKVLIFVVGAAMAGVAGVLYAHYISFIDPTSFTVMESILILSMVIIGGAGSPWGPAVGAVALVTLPEALRFVGMPSAVAANVRNHIRNGIDGVYGLAAPRALGALQLREGRLSDMNQTVLQFDGLCKTFDGITALAEFTGIVRNREILGLIGPNGAGKTTFFHVATGFIRPDRGNVHYGGRKLVGYPPYKIARLGIARTFQDLRLIHQLSVLENVLLAFPNQPGERLWNVFFRWRMVSAREREITKRAASLLEDAGLADKANNPAEALSYGEQKLLSLVCCLATGAELLLLDEPVAGIAPAMIEKILSIIQNLPKQGKSVILIEHNLDAVMQVCDRVIFMDAGRKVSEGTPTEVRNDSKVIEAYID